MAHDDSFRINIAIADMHRLTARILYFNNAFNNMNVPINKRICFSPQTYYMYWFERYYPNVTLNQDSGIFFIQCMSGIQVKTAGKKWNGLPDAVVKILKYKKSTIYHDVYIKVLYYGTVSYIKMMMFSTLTIMRQNILN